MEGEKGMMTADKETRPGPGRKEETAMKPKTSGIEQEKRKRGRPAGSKNKVKVSRPDRQPITDPGDNAKILQYSLALSRLPKININDLQSVKARIDEFFAICTEHDIKPAIASLALAFGCNRMTFFNWITGKYDVIKNRDCLDAIKNAYDIINSQYEIYMNAGKINPVAGIFLMKNNLGYQDTTQHIITANNDQAISLPDITERAGLLEE